MDKICHPLPLWHASNGPSPLLAFFGQNAVPARYFSHKKPWQELHNKPSFLPTTKPHPLNPLTECLPPLYCLGTSRWCSNLCVSSTILCICLLLFPRHSSCSCLVSFCYACWARAYLPWREGCVGFWARIASVHFLMDWVLSGQKFLPFQPTRLLFLPFFFLLCPWAYWLSFLPCWLIRFITYFLGLPQPIYFVFTSYCAYGPVGCHSCHVGPLGLLSIFLGFLGPFTLTLPLIVPKDLLTVIPAMLAR